MTPSQDADHRRVRRIVDELVARQADGSLRLLRKPGWVAAAIASGDHLTRPAMLRISDAMAAEPSTRLWAVLLEEVRDSPDVLPISGAEEDMALLNRRFGFLNLALVATSAAVSVPLWLLVCTTDDYALALGPPERVASLVGTAADAAEQAFSHLAADPDWPANIRALLGRVAQTAARYSATAPGSAVWVPAPVSP